MYQFRILSKLVLLLISLILCYVKQGNCQEDDCVQGFPDIEDSSHQSSDSLTKQFVMPQYTFHCSAIITQWEAIVHTEKQSYSIQFQIWRWNYTLRGYQLVGSNLFHRKQTNSGTGITKGVKRTFTVEPPAQLQVAPADIVGVFASDINVHYKSDDVIDVYAAEEVDSPLVGIFAPLNLDPAFNRRIDGAPLITVQTDTTNIMRTPATIHPETQPERYTDSTIVPSRTLSFNETTVYQSGSTLDSTAWTQHKELVIGVTICGVALILFSIGIIATIILYVRARKRKRIAGIETTDGTQVPGRSFFPFRKRPAGSIARDLMNGGRGSGETRGIHMTVLLTESHSANTDTDHSYAYINSELVSSTPRPLVRSNRPPALPPDRISVRQNPCYSATPAVSTEDLKSEEGVSDRVENIYDLPVFFPKSCQAREYEVPIRSPSSKSKTIGKPQHIYELTSDNV